MQPINVLHVIPKLSVGGVENQLLMVLKKYDRERFFPLVCSLSDKGDLGREIEDAGIEVVCQNKLKHRFDWTIVKDIYSLIKHRNIKIVRTHQYHANLYGRLAASMARVPCIIASVHNVYTIDKKIHRRIINRYLARFTDKIVAVSEAVKDDILRFDGLSEDKVTVIYNGIEKERFLNGNGNLIRSELAISLDAPIIGTVGRLTVQKGQKYLLEAISKIKTKFPRIVLLIVGDGPLKEELKGYSKILNISDNVLFLGTRRDIPALLAAMDIFVLPSLWEGLCNSLIEAMAAGKAVVATDIAPIREVLDSKKVGIVIPAEDSDAIAASIETLLQKRSLTEALGRAARERAFFSFDIENTAELYTNLIEDILRKKRWNI
ncbi:MAG: glycosyltransferase [Nitrospirota bacterium]